MDVPTISTANESDSEAHSVTDSTQKHNWLDFSDDGADTAQHDNMQSDFLEGFDMDIQNHGGFVMMEPALKRQRLEEAAELTMPSTSYSSFTSLDDAELGINDVPGMDSTLDTVNREPPFTYDMMFEYDDDEENDPQLKMIGESDDDNSQSSQSKGNGEDPNKTEEGRPVQADEVKQEIGSSPNRQMVQENECEEGEIDDSDDDSLPDEEEIDNLLEGGMEGYSKKRSEQDAQGRKTYVPPVEKQKVILIERGHNPFDILPEGWLVITHNSGMPVYLHKQSRVCTLSRPYFLGPSSSRRHDIPISAIPCLQYQRALQKEQEPVSTATEKSSSEPGEGVESAPAQCSVSHNEPNNQSNATNGVASQSEDSSTSAANQNEEGTDANGRKYVASAVIASAKELTKENSLDPAQLKQYCDKLFQFRTITIRRFQTWKDRRKHNMMLKKASRPALPSDTKLITCPIVADKDSSKPEHKKEFMLNPVGKTKVGILHEYVQQALRVQPKYIFKELENGKTPYSATVIIKGVQYGTGYASSKKAAKMEAARATLEILIPDLDLSSPSGSPKPSESQDKVTENSSSSTEVVAPQDKAKQTGLKSINSDLAFFDEIKVEDPRVATLCAKAGQPSPHQILSDCLKRNYGLGDTDIHMEMHTLKHQKSEFTMRVAKHEAKVISKNKREGKQQAAQNILQKLHPHITSWGSLLRLYNWKEIFREKKEEKRTVGMLQSGTRPNKAILSKLRQEMEKLHQKKVAGEPVTDDQLQVIRADAKASNLLNIDL